MKHYASNPEVAERRRRFYDALRSGQYEQGKEALRQLPLDDVGNEVSPQYCCLGVACDVSGVGYWDSEEYTIDNDNDGYSSWDMYLPHPLIKYYEFYTLSEGSPVIDSDTVRNLIGHDLLEVDPTAIYLNDTLGLTFEQIADAFEATYPYEAHNGSF